MYLFHCHVVIYMHARGVGSFYLGELADVIKIQKQLKNDDFPLQEGLAKWCGAYTVLKTYS